MEKNYDSKGANMAKTGEPAKLPADSEKDSDGGEPTSKSDGKPVATTKDMGPRNPNQPLSGPQPVRGNSPKPVPVNDEVRNLMEYATKGSNPAGTAQGRDVGSTNQKSPEPGWRGQNGK